ncbi:MAG: RdgB/HAM1 family non-canonical purine NTP pyrophosphatase [Deltaproteobacteria bacterium]
MVRLFFATTNPGKQRELAALVRPLGLELSSPEGGLLPWHVEEIGDSFGANALLKAVAAARRIDGWALADDSGLCVDALGGAPGVQSARWSGEGDEGNNARLLRELEGVPHERRTAAYRCALALSDGRGDELLVEAGCHGRIALAPRGAAGFGYDPLFEVPEEGHRTFGELPAEAKARLSHRSRAFEKLVPILTLLAAR